jgi:putative NADPH-quinone reductase
MGFLFPSYQGVRVVAKGSSGVGKTALGLLRTTIERLTDYCDLRYGSAPPKVVQRNTEVRAVASVVAIVGSYHKGGVTDQAVDAVLEGARQRGARTEKINLIEQQIEFCRNCRMCCQVEGPERGECVHQDDLDTLLHRVESASAVVLASPVNFYNVTSIFRRFMERLLGYLHWPWGKNLGPVLRRKTATKKAVLVTSAAMPSLLIPLATGAPRALKLTARILGARPVGKLWIGLTGSQPDEVLRARMRAKAVKLGNKLV